VPGVPSPAWVLLRSSVGRPRACPVYSRAECLAGHLSTSRADSAITLLIHANKPGGHREQRDKQRWACGARAGQSRDRGIDGPLGKGRVNRRARTPKRRPSPYRRRTLSKGLARPCTPFTALPPATQGPRPARLHLLPLSRPGPASPTPGPAPTGARTSDTGLRAHRRHRGSVWDDRAARGGPPRLPSPLARGCSRSSGPGLIVRSADNDAGGVATYSQAGQNSAPACCGC